jgi:hypothetical protein
MKPETTNASASVENEQKSRIFKVKSAEIDVRVNESKATGSEESNERTVK